MTTYEQLSLLGQAITIMLTAAILLCLSVKK